MQLGEEHSHCTGHGTVCFSLALCVSRFHVPYMFSRCSLHVLKMFPTCSQDAPYMFPTCCGCWPQNLLFIEFVSERPQPGELSQTLLVRIFPPFSPTTVPSVSSDSLSGTVSAGTGSWGERWCFAIVYKTRPLDSCNNEAKAQIKAKITGII